MTNIVLTAEAYAQKLIDTFGNALDALQALKAGLDANGRINGLPGTAALAKDVQAILEAQITDADINAALADHDIVRRKEDPEAQETLVTYPTPGGFKDAAALVRFLVATDGANRTVSKVLGWLKAGDRVWATFGYWRLERKPKRFQDAPKATPETLSAYQIEKLKSEGRCFDAGFEAFRAGFDDSYGCHYGLRSERGDAIKAYRDGWAAAKAAAEAPKAPEDLTVDELAAELADFAPKASKDITADTLAPSLRQELFGQPEPSRHFGFTHQEAVAWLWEGMGCPLTPEVAKGLVAGTYKDYTQADRDRLVAYVGIDDDQLLAAWVEAVAELQPAPVPPFEGPSPQERKDIELRRIEQGHQAFERAARRGWDAQDVAWRTQALKGYQDSRNASQVAA